MTDAPPRPSEITPEGVYLARRVFLRRTAALAGAWPLGVRAAAAECGPAPPAAVLLPGERLSTFEEITGYNNFYEYSPEKTAIKHLAVNLKPRPWQVRIEGEVAHPRTVEVDELLREFPSEDRVYRLRCVEGWSIVVPWQGFPLCALLAKAQPTSRAKYVRFVTLQDPERFYGQRHPTLPWPYTEALTIAEAMHPLTILASGIYGKPLPNQNGAPIRLVVPWKFGFKSIKSIVTIRLEEQRPLTTWPQVAPGDYGFYANVDPRVPLARFSQSRETRIGELQKRTTLPFNGYAAQVASLYAGLDPAQLR
jgi:methionine sulfoxide reductase catalytic subunit